MSNSSSSSGSILIQGHKKINSEVKNVKIWFLTNVNSKKSEVRLFDVILTEYSIYATILMIKGHFQVQCVNFKVR